MHTLSDKSVPGSYQLMEIYQIVEISFYQIVHKAVGTELHLSCVKTTFMLKRIHFSPAPSSPFP